MVMMDEGGSSCKFHWCEVSVEQDLNNKNNRTKRTLFFLAKMRKNSGAVIAFYRGNLIVCRDHKNTKYAEGCF